MGVIGQREASAVPVLMNREKRWLRYTSCLLLRLVSLYAVPHSLFICHKGIIL
jgi:hypothetical protein